MNLEILYDCTIVFITFVGFCLPRYEVIKWSFTGEGFTVKRFDDS